MMPDTITALRQSMERAEQRKADLRTELGTCPDADHLRRLEIRQSLRELDNYVMSIRRELERKGFGRG